MHEANTGSLPVELVLAESSIAAVVEQSDGLFGGGHGPIAVLYDMQAHGGWLVRRAFDDVAGCFGIGGIDT
jgi:hypothetical protein